MKRSIAISVTVYKWLLNLYPSTFRSKYGDEILLLFRDCCRDAEGSHAALFDLWLHSLGDLIVNVCAERLKQMTTREWLGETVVSVTGLAMVLFSGVAMGWIVLGITIGLLVPWDLGTPPAGTFAEAVNNFFERGFVVLPAALVLLLDVVAFFRTTLSGWYKTSTLYWRYAAFHMVVILIGIALTAAADDYQQIVVSQHRFVGRRSKLRRVVNLLGTVHRRRHTGVLRLSSVRCAKYVVVQL